LDHPLLSDEILPLYHAIVGLRSVLGGSATAHFRTAENPRHNLYGKNFLGLALISEDTESDDVAVLKMAPF